MQEEKKMEEKLNGVLIRVMTIKIPVLYTGIDKL